MSLLERCQSLHEKRKRLISLSGNAQETSALQSDANQLTGVSQDFSKAVEIRQAFLEEKITIQALDRQKLQEIADALGRVRIRFKENPSRQTLVAGNDWPVLTGGLKVFIPTIRDKCRQGWSDFTTDIFAKASIIENMVVKTDSNIALLKEYKSLHQEMKRLESDWENIASVRTFKSKGKRLLELAKGFKEFHAPDPVKTFLDAVSSGGAPLDLLTDEVVDWLKEQQMYSKHKIVGGY